MTMTLFAITLCGQCCRRHVVGQRVVNDISVVHSCCTISSLCSESNNANLLLRVAYSLLHLERLFCFTYETQLHLQHGGVYLVTADREFSDVTAPYL